MFCNTSTSILYLITKGVVEAGLIEWGKGLLKDLASKAGWREGVGDLIELFRDMHDYDFQRKSSQKTTIYII